MIRKGRDNTRNGRTEEYCTQCGDVSRHKSVSALAPVNYAGNKLLRSADICPASRQALATAPSLLQHSVTIGSPGDRLDPETRSYMEQHFDHNFCNVRIYTDTQAARSATALNARAYTIGQNIVFGTAEYRPDTESGRSLIAHELTHVIQHQIAASYGKHTVGRSNSAQPAEHQAILAARAVEHGANVQSWRFEPAASQILCEDLSPKEPAAAYLPNEAELSAELAALDANTRQARIAAVLDSVKLTWNRAQAEGLLALLERVRAREREMVASSIKPVSDLPASQPTAYRELLMLDAGLSTGNRVGRDLVTGKTTPAAVSATGARAANAIVQLRRLDDTLRRALVSKSVSTTTGVAMGEVMALYRVEGDMAMPPSEASLAAGVPSGRSDAVTSLNPRPDISHLVFMVDPSRVSNLSDETLRDFALATWFVHIGGLDQVGGLPSPRKTPFAAWSFDNWNHASRADSLQNAEKRWTDALALIKIERLPSASGTSEAIVAQVTDPEALVSTILQEAVMLQERLKKTESLLGVLPPGYARAGTKLSSGLAYLLYNAGTDQSRAVILSALVYGYKVKGSRLSAAINKDSGLKAIISPLVATISGMSRDDLIQSVSTNWSTITAWMARTGNLEIVSEFVETTGSQVWPSWQEHRGNVSRYRVLKEYYSGL